MQVPIATQHYHINILFRALYLKPQSGPTWGHSADIGLVHPLLYVHFVISTLWNKELCLLSLSMVGDSS